MNSMIAAGSISDKRVKVALGATLACLFAWPAPMRAQDVSSEQVGEAVRKGSAYLTANVIRTHAIRTRGGSYSQIGVPMLGVLALLNAGVKADDPAVAALIQDVADLDNQAVYLVGLKCQVLAAASPAKYAKELQDAATWLAKAQTDVGNWGYGGATNRGHGDNSNTQYALQGLHEAANAGAIVPKEVWTKAQTYFANTQLRDGGWTYVFSGPQGANAYGSMTMAGLASLYICGAKLDVGGTKAFVNGLYPDCGKYRQNEALAAGLAWVARNFSVAENPKSPNRAQWLHYYLYGMERVGMISGLRVFGSHDWYREGAAYLVGTQKADGSWGQPYDTAFSVLFLAKGNRPVLVQKLQWKSMTVRNPMEWNRNIHDLENLTGFIADKFGKPVTWQTASLDLPISELRMAPLLFITGHDFPVFTPAEVAKLRQFVETGGTLLCEACCGSKAYQDGMRKFAVDLFPEYQLKPLPPSHPVFSSYYNLSDTYGLEAIEVGCRVGVFFSPKALSCLWEMQDFKDAKGKWSEMAFQIGTNIAAYATGKEMLADRLDKVVLAEAPHGATTQPLEVPRGAVRLARLIHDGDYDCDARCLENLSYLLRDKAKVAVVPASKHVSPTDEKLAEYPVLFMTGHSHFKYTPEQIKALRTYLDRGGFLLADACCGREPFDKSFREMVKQLYPEGALTPLPADHPLYAGRIGVPLGELRYRKALADELKSRGTTRPPLEAVTDGGRTTILYSPYDWSCALEGDKPFSCRGYIDEDGQKLALDLVLFAIGY
jgi:hypothetical protein